MTNGKGVEYGYQVLDLSQSGCFARIISHCMLVLVRYIALWFSYCKHIVDIFMTPR